MDKLVQEVDMRLFAAASHVDPKFKSLKDTAIEVEKRNAELQKGHPTYKFVEHGLRVDKKSGVLVEPQGENDNLPK